MPASFSNFYKCTMESKTLDFFPPLSRKSVSLYTQYENQVEPIEKNLLLIYKEKFKEAFSLWFSEIHKIVPETTPIFKKRTNLGSSGTEYVDCLSVPAHKLSIIPGVVGDTLYVFNSLIQDILEEPRLSGLDRISLCVELLGYILHLDLCLQKELQITLGLITSTSPMNSCGVKIEKVKVINLPSSTFNFPRRFGGRKCTKIEQEQLLEKIAEKFLKPSTVTSKTIREYKPFPHGSCVFYLNSKPFIALKNKIADGLDKAQASPYFIYDMRLEDYNSNISFNIEWLYPHQKTPLKGHTLNLKSPNNAKLIQDLVNKFRQPKLISSVHWEGLNAINDLRDMVGSVEGVLPEEAISLYLRGLSGKLFTPKTSNAFYYKQGEIYIRDPASYQQVISTVLSGGVIAPEDYLGLMMERASSINAKTLTSFRQYLFTLVASQTVEGKDFLLEVYNDQHQIVLNSKPHRTIVMLTDIQEPSKWLEWFPPLDTLKNVPLESKKTAGVLLHLFRLYRQANHNRHPLPIHPLAKAYLTEFINRYV